MNTLQIEWTWLDESNTLTLSELSEMSGMSASDLDELVDYGALTPLNRDQDERCFSASCASALRTAGKLRLDFDLDLFAVAMLLGYLHRIEVLEKQVQSLKAHMPSHVLQSV